MKLTLNIETRPQSFDAEDAMENALQDRGLRLDLERAIERELENIMGWRDISVRVSIGELKGE